MSWPWAAQLDDVAHKRVIGECFENVSFKGKVLMDKSRRGMRTGENRAEHQFWYFEDSMMTEGEEVAKGTVCGTVKAVW